MQETKSRKDTILTIPNALSVLRILMIPLFVWLYMRAETDRQYLAAAAVVVLSGLTDLLDGWIARRFNQVSELGKALDPTADKLTQAAIIICLMLRYRGVIYLFALFAIKEISMAVISVVLLRKGKKLNGAMWFGKLSTAVFYLCMVCLVAIPSMADWVRTAALWVTGAFLLLSFVMYIPQYRKLFRETRV